MTKPNQPCSSRELLMALKVTSTLLARASDSGSLWGKHDVDWKHLKDGVRNVIIKAEGRAT